MVMRIGIERIEFGRLADMCLERAESALQIFGKRKKFVNFSAPGAELQTCSANSDACCNRPL